jgi:NADH-quinone oxidoreductase subunit M
MIDANLLIAGPPILGAALVALLWKRPRESKLVALAAVGIATVALFRGLHAVSSATDASLMMLVSIMALVSILAQPLTGQCSLAIVVSLLTLGLSQIALAGSGMMAQASLGILMGSLAVFFLWRPGSATPDALSRGAGAVLGMGVVALAMPWVVPHSSYLWHLIVCAILLPLFPLQVAYVGALNHLPGTAPALLAVALPALGWQGLVSVTPMLPPALTEVMVVVAVAGALYQAVRVWVQFHLIRMIASLTTILLSVVWWHVGTTGQPLPEAGWYGMAVTVAGSGLLLAAQQLEARYGFLDLVTLRGLARTMPRYAALTGLLLMAAMGLPFFAVFSSFVGMMARTPVAMPRSTALVLLIWLVASLLFMRLFHRLLFGQPRTDVVYDDLSVAEVLPLALVVALLLIGVRSPVPPPSSTQAPPAVVAEELR